MQFSSSCTAPSTATYSKYMLAVQHDLKKKSSNRDNKTERETRYSEGERSTGSCTSSISSSSLRLHPFFSK